jgi:hypothetical protein
MLSFILAAACALNFRSSLPVVARVLDQSGPIVAPAERAAGLWVVSAQMAGKPVHLLLGIESDSALSTKVALAKGVDTRDPIEVTLSGRTIGAAQLAHDVPTYPHGHYDGVLGFDILKTCAIGFDVPNSTVTIWRGGIAAAAASAWVLGGEVRPGSSGRPELWTAPVVFDSNGTPSIVVGIGKNQRPAELDLSAPGFGLFEPDLVASGATLVWRLKGVNIYASTEVHLGSMGPWLVVGAITSAKKDELNQFFLPIEALDSERVIVDLANQKLYGQMLDDRSRSAIELSFLSGVPMYLDGTALRVGPIGDSRDSSLAAKGLKEGDEIVEFWGTPAATFADLIRNGAACNIQEVTEFYRSISRRQPEILKLVRNGKKMTLNLEHPKKSEGAE